MSEPFDKAIRMGELPDSGLIARQRAVLPRAPCASGRSLDRRGTPEHPADLAAHECLRMRGAAPLRALRNATTTVEVAVGRRFRRDSVGMMRRPPHRSPAREHGAHLSRGADHWSRTWYRATPRPWTIPGCRRGSSWGRWRPTCNSGRFSDDRQTSPSGARRSRPPFGISCAEFAGRISGTSASPVSVHLRPQRSPAPVERRDDVGGQGFLAAQGGAAEAFDRLGLWRSAERSG